MSILAAVLLPSVLLASAAAAADDGRRISIAPNGGQASTVGASENFTGSVRVDSRFHAKAPARVGGGIVTFEPGARTAWHTHPLGQTLIVSTGKGLVQEWEGEVREINPGEVVWIPPGVKHWHGASPEIAMSHVAIAEALEGSAADWMEKVTDDQYAGR